MGPDPSKFESYVPDARPYADPPSLEPSADVGLYVETNTGLNGRSGSNKISSSNTQRTSFIGPPNPASSSSTQKMESSFAGFGVEACSTNLSDGSSVVGIGVSRPLVGNTKGQVIARTDGLVEGRISKNFRYNHFVNSDKLKGGESSQSVTVGAFANVDVPATVRNAKTVGKHAIASADTATHNTFGRFIGGFHSFLNAKIGYKAVSNVPVLSNSGGETSKARTRSNGGFWISLFGDPSTHNRDYVEEVEGSWWSGFVEDVFGGGSWQAGAQ
jgi:hypothetical protein